MGNARKRDVFYFRSPGFYREAARFEIGAKCNKKRDEQAEGVAKEHATGAPREVIKQKKVYADCAQCCANLQKSKLERLALITKELVKQFGE